MTPATWIYLLGTMVVLAAIPSTSVMLVVARAATSGVSRGAAVAAGIVVGDLIFVGLALLGMSALAETLGSVFSVIQMMGGIYLVWLGLRLMCAKNDFELAPGGVRRVGVIECFVSGLVLTLGDVKAILFYASFFPAVVDMHTLNVNETAGVVAATIIGVGGVKLVYAVFARRIVARVKSRTLQKGGRMAAGGLMTGAGAYLIIKS